MPDSPNTVRDIVSDGAVHERQCTPVPDAAGVIGGVAAHGAVGKGKRACVLDASCRIQRSVAAHGAVGKGKRASVPDAAAVAGLGIAILNGNAADGHEASVDVEHSVTCATINNRDRLAITHNSNVIVNVEVTLARLLRLLETCAAGDGEGVD